MSRVLYETHMKVIEQEHKKSRNSPLPAHCNTFHEKNKVQPSIEPSYV